MPAAIACAREGADVAINYSPSEEEDATAVVELIREAGRKAAALPHVQPGSVIIGTTSEQATDPSPDIRRYAMAKAATTNDVRGLAKQRAPEGIRVNGVAPGPIRTPLQVSGGATLETFRKFGAQTPMKRPGQPAGLASIPVRLAADDASYATGQVYGATGGAGSP